MSTPHCTTLPPLWHFEGRDRAITLAVLDGVAPSVVAQLHDLSVLRVMLIVCKTCARVRPGWVDDWGMSRAWSTPLSTLRAERWRFRL